MRCSAVIATALVLPALGASACGSNDDEKATTTGTGQSSTNAANGGSTLPTGSENVDLDPADFTTRIDNPYWPMVPGRTWKYSGEEGGDKVKIVVTVTPETRKIEGITARVVSDVVSREDGSLIEKTFDWYGQDSDGNVWYLGEDTKEYENGKVSSTEGSWEAGVDGAEPGVIMPADPRPGLTYRQEYYKGHAEDGARVLKVGTAADVPTGTFDDCLETEDFTKLEPGNVEHKYYAKDVGPVLRTNASGGGREELVSFAR
jgi:hypothetical protein